MQEKKIQKKYIAILDGVLPNDSGIIETYMRRTSESIIVREVCEKEQGADFALTEYRVICRSDKHTMVLAEPKTGRTHQLRVHFASLGCAIEGDDMYGSESPYISRHALHSFELSFPRPSGDQQTVYAPIPEDMKKLSKIPPASCAFIPSVVGLIIASEVIKDLMK
jgi:23S rRNA pseudouridine1911/1915/1917 synthase